LSEENVRAKIRTGDIASATATVLLLYGAEVFGFLAGVLDDLDAARDVYASFRERLWRGLGTFRWNCALRTWSYAIARDELARYRESGSRAAPPPASEDDFPRTTAEPAGEVAILALRRQLVPEEREILILRVDRELPWREIALAFLGCATSEDALEREAARLRHRFHEIKKRLAKAAEEQGIPYPAD
jgi:RNA polymerase sigma-70 factor (ECF subfamily)